jgi:uncharacterized membrane protein YraQ (UPF0718 family)
VQKKRIAIASIVLAAGAALFWGGSRYPKLREKSEQGDRVRIGEVLSHDARFEVDPSAPAIERIALTTLNWLDTNKLGMSFGLFFGSCGLTILGLVTIAKRRRSRFLSALAGIAIGAPLGVCVNCAAPIGRSLRAAGLPAETYLAVMHSSPTLNVIVITMVWSLFPFEFFVVKLALTILFLLVVVPVLPSLLEVDRLPREPEIAPLEIAPKDEGWGGAAIFVLLAFGRSLRYLAWRTVPLMILAGILGAVMAELIPTSIFLESESSIALLVLASVIGALLPVPMAFDVVLTFVLWRSGLPEPLAMAFLFTLGIYSVFPFSILWAQVSKKLATAVLGSVIFFGIGSGLVIERYRSSTLARSMALFDEAVKPERIGGAIAALCSRFSESNDRERCTHELSAQVKDAADPALCEELDPPHDARCKSEVRAQNEPRSLDRCRELGEAREQMRCVEAAVSAAVARGEGSDLCPELKDEAKIRSCYVAAAKKAAVETNDPKACDHLGADLDRGQCVAELISARLSKGAGLEVCGLFSVERDRTMCRELAGAQIAEEREDPTACRALGFPQERRRCERAVVERRIARGAGASTCSGLERRADREACRLQTVFARVKRGEGPAPCAEIPKTRDRDACTSLAASMSPDLAAGGALCRQIESADLRTACEDRLRARSAKGLEDCKGVLDAALSSECTKTIAFALASSSGDEQLCEKISDRTAKAACRGRVISDRAARGLDPRLCEKIDALEESTQCKAQLLGAMSAEIVERLAKAIADRSGRLLDRSTAKRSRLVQSSTVSLRTAPPLTRRSVLEREGLSIEAIALFERRGEDRLVFRRREGRELGIDLGNDASPLDYVEPQCHGRGLAAGDLDRDGWVDLAFATKHGVALFRGVGPDGFEPMPFDAGPIADKDVLVVAIVDIDGDGWDDLFAGTVGEGHYFLRNLGGRFFGKKIAHLRDDAAPIARAATFGDLDRDGSLDLVIGSWRPSAPGGNKVFFNRNGRFEPAALPGDVPGLTLSTLLTDLDGDGWLDLLIGNDFEAPDVFFKGTDRGLTKIPHGTGAVPFTPIHTMSYDTADIDGDLDLDVFATDLPFAGEVSDGDCEAIEDERDRRRCEENDRLERAVRRNDLEECLAIDGEENQRACLVAGLLYLAGGARRPELCEHIPMSYASERALCMLSAASPVRKVSDNARLSLSSAEGFAQHQANVLLVQNAKGGFEERAAALGLAKTSWSWSAKFADLDSDGWQDLLVANGVGGFSVAHSASYPKYFFRNLGGGKLESRAKEAGLDDPLHASAFVYLDFDADGDLDVVMRGFNAPPRVFVNQSKTGHDILFELEDHRSANVRAIGARITIAHGSSKQVRELKSGGAYLSFDPPIAHFGLGKDDHVREVEVWWPDGVRTQIREPLSAGARYVIRRR